MVCFLLIQATPPDFLIDDAIVDDTGMHQDVHVQDIDSDEDIPQVLNKSNPTANVKHFFEAAPKTKDKKNHSQCIPCKWVLQLPSCLHFIDPHI